MDVAQGGRAEAELDAFIERCSRKDPAADEREELWKAGVAAYNVRRSDEMRVAWCEYHREQAVRLRAVFEPLIARHEDAAAKLMEAQPIGAA